MASRRLEVVIAGDAKGAKKAFADTEKAAGGFKSKMAGVSKSMIGFGGAMTAGVTLPIAAALTVAVKAAAEEEKSQALLRNSLRKTVGATEGMVTKTEEWITALQNSTGVMDDELRPALSRLLISGRSLEQAQGDLNIALDISAATGKPLATVIQAMGKAALGSVSGLARLGLQTKDAAGNTLSYDEALKAASETMGGAAARAADTTAGKAAIMSAKFEDLKETLGEALLPILSDFADTLSGLADKFSKLTPTQQKWITVGLLSLAVIGPLSIAIGGLAAAIGFLASPIGIAIVAAAALAGGLVYLYNTNETFRAGVDATTNFLVQEAGPAFVQFGQQVGDALAGVVEVVQRNWPQIQTTITTVLGHIQAVTTVVLEGIRVYWNTFGQRIYDNVVRVFRGIQGVIGIAMNIIRGIVQVVTSAIRGDWSGALDAVLRTTQRVWSGVIGVIRNAVGVIRNLVSGLAGLLRGAFDGVAGAVRGAANAARAAWNNTIGGRGITIPAFDPPGPGSFGGFSLKIPTLHTGGEFRAPTIGGEGLALLKDREIVLPAGGGGGRVVNQTHNWYITGSNAMEIGEQVEMILRREQAFAGATGAPE